MPLQGSATVDGTRQYRDRMVQAGMVRAEHFRDGPGGLALSSVGLGTYLGGYDAGTDALYLAAIKEAVGAGCNVLDTAINYRCQRSERIVGQAVLELSRDRRGQREEILITTKGGYIPYDGEPPADSYAYLQKTFVMPGIIRATDLVAECHCLAPSYLRHQMSASLTNLGLTCVDVYYLHNPETQLDEVSRDEFLRRMRAAFEVLEEAVGQGKIRLYGTATWNGYRVPASARGHVSLEALVRLAEEVAGPSHHFRVVQLPYSLAMPEAFTDQTQTFNGSTVSLLDAAAALGVYVMGSASVLQGRLTRALPADLVRALGDGTDAQRALQFVRSTPGLGTALVGMKQAAHVRENLAVGRTALLSSAQVARLVQ